MPVYKNYQSTIRCEECIKEDICLHKQEFKTKLEKYNVDSDSPIYITVSCRSAVKDVNTREQFAKEYSSTWMSGINNYCEQNRID